MYKTYENCPRKRYVRRFILSQKSHLPTLITLAGPNPVIVYEEAKEFGFKRIYSYETDRGIYDIQKSSLELALKQDVFFNFKDILHCPLKNWALYDLDFCGTIFQHGEYIKRFKDYSFIFTFCIRGKKDENIIDVLKFFGDCIGDGARKATRIRNKNGTNTRIYISIGTKRFFAMTYRDKDGAPMISITNLN